VTITRDDKQYTYTISSTCSDDKGNGSNLVIKKYTGLNNLGFNALLKLVPVDDGYIGVFDYSRNAGKCKENECDDSMEGFAIVKIKDDGDFGKISIFDKSELGYTRKNLVSVEDLFVFNDSYFVTFSIIGNESYQFEDTVTNMAAKYDKDINRLWVKEYDVPGVTKTIKVNNTLGLVQNYLGENVKVSTMNPENGTILGSINFDGESDSGIIYKDNYFYDFYENYNGNSTNDDKIENAYLIKYNINGKIVYSNDSKQYLNDYQSIYRLNRGLFINNKNIFLNTSTYNSPKESYVNVYDIGGNYLRTHLVTDYDSQLSTYFDRIIYEYNDYYSLVQRKDLKFIIDTFNNEGTRTDSKYYEAYTNSYYYSNEYIALNEGLVFYASSHSNAGEVSILFFD
jgi:hypothetical protein